MTAARSALEQRLEAFGLQFCDAASPHQRVLRALRALQCASGSDGDGEEEAAAAPGKAAAGAGEGDPDAAAADIVSLTQPLGDTFSAPLAKLLLRLLPPADGAVPALEPLSISETVLQAAALRSRRVCSYLRCPNLAAPGAGQAASKRCGACRQARYDCAACQRADWNAWHRHGCKVDAAAADVRQRRLQ